MIFTMWCVIGGGMIIASSRVRTLRFLCLVLLISLFVALSGLRIYLIYGNFRTLDMWDELGFSRTYLNWGYTVADGAAVAMVIGLYSRFMSLKQLALLACFAVCATFLLVGGARAPLLGVGLAGPGRDLGAHSAGGTGALRSIGGSAGRHHRRHCRSRPDRHVDHDRKRHHDPEPLHADCRAGRRGARGRGRQSLALLAGGGPILAPVAGGRQRVPELLVHVPQWI